MRVFRGRKQLPGFLDPVAQPLLGSYGHSLPARPYSLPVLALPSASRQRLCTVEPRPQKCCDHRELTKLGLENKSLFLGLPEHGSGPLKCVVYSYFW